MHLDLTERQYRILEFIVKVTEREGYPPTIREIAEHFGIRSTTGVRRHLKALEKKGYIHRLEGKARGIILHEKVKRLFYGRRIPVIGRIAAGKPILAIENIEGILALEELFPNDQHFALRVQGDSMVQAGILPGDVIIVREQPTADLNDIVVAIIEDEATVKRLSKIGNKLYLKPENPHYEPIPLEGATIVGKVVGLIRKI